MKVNEIIVRVLENTMTQDGKKYTQSLLAEELSARTGKPVSVAAVNDRLKNESMKTNSVIEMLDILGYELVIRPKKDSRETYVVEAGSGRKRVGK